MEHRRWRAAAAVALAMGALAGALSLALAPTGVPVDLQTGWNVVPTRTIVDQVGNGRWWQLAGNVLLLAPLGACSTMAIPRRRRRLAIGVGLGIAASLTIEVLQDVLGTGRSSDVDDVLLNTVGFVGAWVAAARLLDRSSRGSGTPRVRTWPDRTHVPKAPPAP